VVIPAKTLPPAGSANRQARKVSTAPRRVHTQSHIDYVVEVITEVWKNRERIRGLRVVEEAPFLRHFTAHLEPV
jgi:tryptophanase